MLELQEKTMDESNPTPPTATRQGVRQCAAFMTEMLRIGWKKDELTPLQKLWWRMRDDNGVLLGRGLRRGKNGKVQRVALRKTAKHAQTA